MPVVKAPGPTQLMALDIPLRHDGDIDGGIYLAATGEGSWRGCGVFASRDGGERYAGLARCDTYSTLGATTLGSVPVTPYARDLANEIAVELPSGVTLESVSEFHFLDGFNAALVGDEIIYFKKAVQIEVGRWRLSELLRGRRGTEWAMGQHQPNERFVMLTHYLGKAQLPPLALNQPIFLKAPSLGAQALDDCDPISFTWQGQSLKPYAPCHVTVTRRDESVLVSWQRRSRIGGELLDHADVPLGELDERYRVEVLDRDDMVLWTADTASTSIEIPHLSQGSKIGVYQLSSAVGKGFGAYHSYDFA